MATLTELEVARITDRLMDNDAQIGYDGARSIAGTAARKTAEQEGLAALSGAGGIGTSWHRSEDLLAAGWTAPASSGGVWLRPAR